MLKVRNQAPLVLHNFCTAYLLSLCVCAPLRRYSVVIVVSESASGVLRSDSLQVLDRWPSIRRRISCEDVNWTTTVGEHGAWHSLWTVHLSVAICGDFSLVTRHHAWELRIEIYCRRRRFVTQTRPLLLRRAVFVLVRWSGCHVGVRYGTIFYWRRNGHVTAQFGTSTNLIIFGSFRTYIYPGV